jgi:hypothetical protein
MIQRRALAAGIETKISCHSFRATVSSSGSLAKEGQMTVSGHLELSPQEISFILDKRSFLVMYGTVEYFDIFQSNKDKPRVTQYCLFWDTRSGNVAPCTVFNTMN